MVIICITTSVIYIFNAHSKYSIPQTYHLNYDMIIRNYEHYLRYGIHNSKCYLRRYFETYPTVSNITTNYLKAHCKYLWKPKKYLLIKVHEEWKPMATCVVDIYFVGCTQLNPKEPTHVSKPNPKDSSKRQRIESGQPTLGHPWPKYSWRPLQENQVFEDELGAIPSAFCHRVPNVNNAQGLWC